MDKNPTRRRWRHPVYWSRTHWSSHWHDIIVCALQLSNERTNGHEMIAMVIRRQKCSPPTVTIDCATARRPARYSTKTINNSRFNWNKFRYFLQAKVEEVKVIKSRINAFNVTSDPVVLVKFFMKSAKLSKIKRPNSLSIKFSSFYRSSVIFLGTC